MLWRVSEGKLYPACAESQELIKSIGKDVLMESNNEHIMENEPLLYRKFHHMIDAAHKNISGTPRNRNAFRRELLVKAGYCEIKHIEVDGKTIMVKQPRPLRKVWKENPRKLFRDIHRTICDEYFDIPMDFITEYL